MSSSAPLFLSTALPPKQVTLILKAVFRSSVLKDVSLTFDELYESLFPAAAPSKAEAGQLLNSMQRILVAAAYYNWTAAELESFLSKHAPDASEAVSDGLVSFWREQREAAHVAVAKSSAAEQRPQLLDISWRTSTLTAAEAESAANDIVTAAGVAGAGEAVAQIQLTISQPEERTATRAGVAAAAAASSGHVVEFSCSKAVLADLLGAVQQARKAAEAVHA